MALAVHDNWHGKLRNASAPAAIQQEFEPLPAATAARIGVKRRAPLAPAQPAALDRYINDHLEQNLAELVRDGHLFGRGVSDDKGHMTSRLLAIDAMLAEDGELPCRIKFVVEGEEEVGSVHLHDFLRAHRQRLAADACLWEFGYLDHREVPLLFAGLRGICYVELVDQVGDGPPGPESASAVRSEHPGE